jgi:hypothetical protein
MRRHSNRSLLTFALMFGSASLRCGSIIGVIIACGCSNHIAKDVDAHATVRCQGMFLSWIAPTSLRQNRMAVKADDSKTSINSFTQYYRAVWNTRDPLRLVVIVPRAAQLHGIEYDVWLVSRQGDLLRSGVLFSENWEWPYCLVEINASQTATLPANRSNCVLGVALLNNEVRFDPSRPTFFGQAVVINGLDNVLRVEPIRWNDETGIELADLSRVVNSNHVRIRPAEIALSSIGTDGLFRYSNGLEASQRWRGFNETTTQRE